MTSRKRALAWIGRITAGDFAGAAKMLSVDCRIEITGQWPYGGPIMHLERLAAFAEAGHGGLPPLILAGSVRRAIANRGLVAIEVASEADYAVLVRISQRRVASARFYFDTRRYAGTKGEARLG